MDFVRVYNFHLGKEEVKVKMSGLYKIPLFILPDAVSTLLHTALCHGTLGNMNYINAFWSTKFSQQRTTGRKESKIIRCSPPYKMAVSFNTVLSSCQADPST